MIKVNDKYYIDATSNCYVLRERISGQDVDSVIVDDKGYVRKDRMYNDLGYYTTIEGLLQGILKTELRKFIAKSTENTLQDLVKEIQRLNDYIKNLNLEV